VARPRSITSAPSLSPGQATYVVERLISERRISPGDVSRIVSEMHREISDLERRLESLRTATGGSSAAAAAPARRGPGRPPGRPAGRRGPGRPPGSGAGAGAGAKRRRRRRGRPPVAAAAQTANTGAASAAAPAKRGPGRPRKQRSAITAEQLASRQLQGRYLALVRQISASKRGQYAKIAKEKGREAAIREMQDAIGK